MKKKVIGVLVPLIDRYYQVDLWRAISKEAHRRGYDVIYLSGSVLDAPNSNEKENNAIYSLAHSSILDGLILLSGTLANYVNQDRFKEFVHQFNKVPMVHISIEMEGCHSVVTNNYASMKKMIDHIIKEHTFESYAYISGPKTNKEAVSRLNAFLEGMSENNIGKDRYRVYYGDFRLESARPIVSDMLDKDQFKPDIIVCANDDMAAGVHQSLEERGIHMPVEIAFTGFDNIYSGQSFTPSFTTIHQPLSKMGRQSVINLDRLIRGLDPLEESVVGDLVVRESCGCLRGNEHWYDKLKMADERELLIERLQSGGVGQISEAILMDNIQEIHELVNPNYIEGIEETLKNLVCMLVDELEGNCKSGSFIKAITKLMRSSISGQGHDCKWWMMIEWYRTYLKKNNLLNYVGSLNEIFYDCAKTFSDIFLRIEQKDSYDFMSMYYNTSELILDMTLARTKKDIFNKLQPYLKSFSFDDFLICLFDQEVRFNHKKVFRYPNNMKVYGGYVNGHELDELVIDVEKIIPAKILAQDEFNDYVIFPYSLESIILVFLWQARKWSSSQYLEPFENR